MYINWYPFVLSAYPGLSSPLNGRVTYNRSPVNGFYPRDTKSTYRCDTGYAIKSGWHVGTCESGGKFNGTKAVFDRCEEV